jgi:hypothetical protein
VYNIDFEKGETCQNLVKDETSQIFEAKVYSDFVGLSDDREPNGLVQTEISKKVHLNTYRHPIKFSRTRLINYGLFSYIEPEITLSKIENNNKRLLLSVKDWIQNNQYAPIKYASTLELRRYQNFSAGFDFNLGLLDLPVLKSTFYADFGFRYGRTAVRDSLRTFQENQVIREKQASDYGVNTLDFYPKLTWEVRSDERYCFTFTYSHHWYFLRDNRFSQVANNATFENTLENSIRVSREYTRIGLHASLNPNENGKGKLFFRYQYYWQQGFWRTGFHQAQVGYAFYILARKVSSETTTK